jgi:ABC-type antimicrobial peptide transport system permease subunit
VEEASVVPALRRAVAAVDPNLPVSGVYFMDDQISDSLAQPRLVANLLGVFGILALVLALSGIYGVVAYSVAGRQREIGVRVALGAGRSQVVRMIVSEGVRPVVVGVLFGLTGAALVTRFLQSLLYGVAATDPVTFVLVPTLILSAAAAASWLPARRAASIPPTRALQADG